MGKDTEDELQLFVLSHASDAAMDGGTHKDE